MFVLKPDGDSGSGSQSSTIKTTAKFFGKLGLYFVAIRIAHIYIGLPSEKNSAQKSS